MVRSILLMVLVALVPIVKADVTLEADKTRVKPGDTFLIKVSATELAGIYGMDLALAWPSAAAKPLDENPDRSGIQAKAASVWGAQSFLAANRFDMQDGVHTLVIARLAPAEPLNGEAILWEGRFTATAPGELNFSIERLEFGTSEGRKIVPEVTRGQTVVSVASPATNELTHTPHDDSPRTPAAVNWLWVALASAGALIVILLIVIWRLARRD